jgi:hypothetical protein
VSDTVDRIRPNEAPAERIDPSETAYLARLNATAQQAKIALGSFGQFLTGKYGLQEADSVRADGTIVRATAPAELGQ